MKVLELIWNLEEAYDRFGDIDVEVTTESDAFREIENYHEIKELVIESEEFIIKCE